VLPIHICLLGSPHVEKDGQAIVVPRRKTLALLAYLAVTGQMQSRETLAALFWPENDQSSALANLRRDLSRLKVLLGENLLAVDRLQASLDLQVEISLDVVVFKALVAKTKKHAHVREDQCSECLDALKEAVEIYRGDFMAGFNLTDSPAFDEWQFFQREELRQLLAEALQRLINGHIFRAEYEQGIFYARRWLSLDRLHEPAHRALVQLYGWVGQQAAALRQYAECQRILREELGIEPDEETQAVYEAVKSRTLGSPELTGDSRPAAPALQVYPVEDQPAQEERFTQAIRFCTAPDGVGLAYATTGQGPVLVKAANWLSHLEYDWNSPVWRHWLTGLGRNNTLVRYDERGCGLSDWNVNEFTLDAWVMDLEAVVDALGLERFPLLGMSQGAAIAVEYAVRHPEKVSRLILYGGYIRGRRHRNLAPEQLEEQDVLIQLIKVGWGKEHPAFRQVFSTLFLPEGTPEQLHAFNELQRISSSPEIAAQIVNGFQGIDVVEQARRVTQPALILHARGDLRIPFEEGRLMAATIPNARLVTLESRNHILMEDEPAWKRFLEEVHAFLKEEEREV
jgi:DNA-binding SARP family transcriptional activator/alpha-beta hydrolase superfamily lysophospholipase